MSTTSRTLTLVIFLGLATVSCRRADPIGSQPRVVRNLQSLVTLAVEMRRSDWKGRFTGTESPMPPGEPWRKPVKYDFPTYANLISGEDGLFHEQYEITVDPTGFNGPHMELVPIPCGLRDSSPPDGYQGPNLALLPCTPSGHTPDSGPSVVRWCKVRAVGTFGRGAELWEISTRLVAEGERVTQEPMTARRLGQ
jgi:hypothetical protein